MKKKFAAAVLGLVLCLCPGRGTAAMEPEAAGPDIVGTDAAGFGTAETDMAESNVAPDTTETDMAEPGALDDFTSELAVGFMSGGGEVPPMEEPAEEAPAEEEPEEEEPAKSDQAFVSDGTQEIQKVQSRETVENAFHWTDWEAVEGGYRLHKKIDPSVESDSTDFADMYYTAADGIVEITTETEKGTFHTGWYLFDEEGIVVTGRRTMTDTMASGAQEGVYYFADLGNASLYSEFATDSVSMNPYNSNVGQMKTDYWYWEQATGAFHYYGEDGAAVTIAQLDALARENGTYTGYYKIQGEYYCLDSNGKPRTGDITLEVNGVSAKYYFEPSADANGIPGRMFREGWRTVSGAKGDRWLYYGTGESDPADLGKLYAHGTVTTSLNSKKGYVFLIDKNGYILKSTMKKAEDGSYYATDAKGRIYKDKLVTYKGNQYYFGSTGARASWKNRWHRCPGAGNRMYYFGSTPGKIVKKTGWQKVYTSSGKLYGWFYFNNNGNHYANKLKNDYYFKPDGKLASGITVINGRSYFFQPSTEEYRNGKMVKGQYFTYKNKGYYASASGVLRKNGWQKIDGSYYYFQNLHPLKNTFVKKNNTYGYLDSTGKFTTGWVIVDDANNLVRYINPDKAGYVTDTSRWIDGKLYYFDKNGYRMNDLTSIYTGPYSVDVDRINGVMTIYADTDRTIPVKSIRVSVGNPGTETPVGWYTLKRSNRWEPLMGPSWGQYGTHVEGAGRGGIYVHSVACNSPNCYNLPVSTYYLLGSPASHGCIRTCVGDAKWVYDNCNGSGIHIFDGAYRSEESFKGPLGRRPITPVKAPKNGGYYDPTDPNA